jgi:ketol-acid reductoisomerase
MREVLAEVRSGRFAEALRTEAQNGYPLLAKARAEAGNNPIERVSEKLQRLSNP